MEILTNTKLDMLSRAITKLKYKFVIDYTKSMYTETFSPVIKSKSVKILLSVANAESWEVHQMDVKTAFLNAE